MSTACLRFDGSCNVKLVDIGTILDVIIGSWEMAFPGKIRSWYLIGSHVSGTARANSD